MRSVDAQRRTHCDRGTILPLVLMFIVVLGLVLAGTARYTATNLRYSTVVEERTSASAAAEAAVRYGIQRVRSNSITSCESGPVRIAPTHDPVADPILADADTIDITCMRLDGGQASLSDWAAVVTGVGVSGSTCTITDTSDCRLAVEDRGDHAATGRIFLPSLRQYHFRVNVDDVEFGGNLFYDGSSDDCATIERYDESSSSWDDDIVLTTGSFVCWPQTWDETVDEPPVPGLSHPVDALGNETFDSPAWTMVGSCRVFEPGWYHDLELLAGGENYFRSGHYVFDDVVIDTSFDGVATYKSGTTILAGYSNEVRFDTRLVASSSCEAARAIDALDGGPNGATWYLGGDSRIEITRDTTIEMIPMLHSDGVRDHAVSIHVLGPGSFEPSTLGDGVDAIDVGTPSGPHALFQGQIWSPTQPIDLYELAGDSNGQITSGIVAAQVLVDSTNGSTGALGPDRMQADHELLLTATATVEGVTMEARAVVEHRPSADQGDRVAVRSIRITD